MNPHLLVHAERRCVVVEVTTASLQDVMELETMGKELYRLVDEEDQKRMVLDLRHVGFISSQAIGIFTALHKKTADRGGKLILCGLQPRLLELLRITRLDKLLTVQPDQKKATDFFERLAD